MGENIKISIIERYQHQSLFQSALIEFLGSVIPYLESIGAGEEDYARLERLMVPERMIVFKVVWEDDKGKFHHNLGYRVQFNSALGPYKGGLRFDPSVNEDVLKFLGFEQIFKNALTGLPLGGGKGGSDFDPKGKSDAEVRRFCTSFMTELVRYIGPNTDVPAGDIGVGGREIGYLYGAYKKLMNRTDGTLTGKGVVYSGSQIRTEATGYGAVYFIKEMLTQAQRDIRGMRAVISGSGNVATHVAEKLIQEGAIPLSLSDREGYIYNENGLTQELIDAVKIHKEKRGSLKDLLVGNDVTYHEGAVWQTLKADIYIPAATQQEIKKEDAEAIVRNGAVLVAEGSNMPSTAEAVEVFQVAGVLFGPAKAVNAGGVAVSGLEMSQNAMHLHWATEEVDEKLRFIMKHIHDTCVHYGKHEGGIDYVKGANVGGFVHVFKAMGQLGW
ncbi:MAG: NADP-specific glutamate dehydrogenase [Candidatus Pacebacteria bacterium]|nr:NADP-specific glutamate dehydrogenase [Candidatus Paceibacterota bacterium]MCF7857443.1 NADP-specific glutamate dehydrogenase [Candidatus Paceibacterota bacterium]